MRMPIIVLFVIAAALLGETQVSNAQSAYSYPPAARSPSALTRAKPSNDQSLNGSNSPAPAIATANGRHVQHLDGPAWCASTSGSRR